MCERNFCEFFPGKRKALNTGRIALCNGYVESNNCLSSFHVLSIEIIEWIASTFLACGPKRDRFEILFSLRSFTWTIGILHNTTIPKFVCYQRKDDICERKHCELFLGRTKALNTGRVCGCVSRYI